MDTRSPVSRSIENRNRPSLELQARPDNPRLVYRDTEVFTKRKYTQCTGTGVYVPTLVSVVMLAIYGDHPQESITELRAA